MTAVVARLAPHAIAALPSDAFEDWIGGVARRGAEALPVAPLASRALALLWAEGAGQALLDQGLDLIEAALAANKATIVEQVRASRAHGFRNGSMRLSPTEFCRDWAERWKTCVGPTIPGAPRLRGG